jgi:hypothetical protein
MSLCNSKISLKRPEQFFEKKNDVIYCINLSVLFAKHFLISFVKNSFGLVELLLFCKSYICTSDPYLHNSLFCFTFVSRIIQNIMEHFGTL